MYNFIGSWQNPPHPSMVLRSVRRKSREEKKGKVRLSALPLLPLLQSRTLNEVRVHRRIFIFAVSQLGSPTFSSCSSRAGVRAYVGIQCHTDPPPRAQEITLRHLMEKSNEVEPTT